MLKSTLTGKKLSPILVVGGVLLALTSLHSRKEEQPQDAMMRQFPTADVRRESLYLSQADQARLSRSLGERIESRLVSMYLAESEGKLLGVGLFDTHVVRTKTETLFIAFKPNGVVHGVEVIAFHEPTQYRAPERWLKLLIGKAPGPELARDLPAISGATMTVQAVKTASRKTRMLFDLYRDRTGP